MSSKKFQIQGGNFNMTSGTQTSTNFKLADVIGDLAAGNFATKGYHLQTGFQNIAAGSAVSFSISPVLVDFGSLTPNNPLEKQIFLKISNGKVPGYTVKVAQNHQLTSPSQATTPDTVCDNHQKPCTQTQASRWQLNSSFGLGYRVSGTAVTQDFNTDFAYRPFASISRNDKAVLIMESSRENTTDEAVMTVKLNVDHNQPVGMYENVIIFTALAGI